MGKAALLGLRRSREYLASHFIAYAISLATGEALVAVLEHLTTGRSWSGLAWTAAGFWPAGLVLYGVRRLGQREDDPA